MTSTTLPTQQASDIPQNFTEVEQQATRYFFARLRTIWGAGKFNQQWPTDKDLQLSRREYAKQIGKYSQQEIDEALENAKKQKANGNPDFQWPDINIILSGCNRNLNASHREFLPAPKETKEQRQERIEYGKNQIKKLRDIF